MRMKSILPALAFAAALALSSGCGTNHHQKDKNRAQQHWGRARANVMHALAKDQYSTGNFDPARKTVNDAIALDPNHGPLRVLSAKLAIESGQLELADKELAAARKINPKDAEADYLSGVVYQRWQKHETALDYYVAAADKAPEELAYILARSEMLVVMGRHEEALRLLQAKVVYFEHSAVIRDAVGQLLVQFKKYDEAAEVLRQASILDTRDMTIQEHLALALFFGKQYREAIDPLRKLLATEPYAKRADLHSALGQCLMEIHKLREARQSFETAVQLDPQGSGNWLALARVALQQNDLPRAELSLRRAIALDPARGESRLLLGYLRLRQNKHQEALANNRSCPPTPSSAPPSRRPA